MMKSLRRIEQLEQTAIWDQAHVVCSVFARRLYQICNDDERRAMADHCRKIKGGNNIRDLLARTGDPKIDRVLAKAQDNAEIYSAFLELCRLVDAWELVQKTNSNDH